MSLQQLANLGAFVGPEVYEDTDVTWAPTSEAEPVKFEVSVKKESSVSDFEFINMKDAGLDDRSTMARSVHRLVKIRTIGGEKAEHERLSLDDCMRLKPSLLLALFIAIGTVKTPVKKPVAAKKRAARKPTTTRT